MARPSSAMTSASPATAKTRAVCSNSARWRPWRTCRAWNRQLIPVPSRSASISPVPQSIPRNTTDFRPKNAHAAGTYRVAPGYFQTAGTRLLAGREFTPQDKPNAPRVAIVNQTFARSVTGAADAVGRRFRLGAGGPLYQIVAIVEDGKYETLTEVPKPSVPILQDYSSTIVL